MTIQRTQRKGEKGMAIWRGSARELPRNDERYQSSESESWESYAQINSSETEKQKKIKRSFKEQLLRKNS